MCGGPISFLSNQVPEGLDKSKGKQVSGTSYAFYIGGLIPPTIMPLPVASMDKEFNIVEAVNNALKEAPGMNMLIDVEVTRYTAGVPTIFWMLGVKVTGWAVKYDPDV